MTFPKEAIKQILQGLDHTNDALWTEDGSPLVTEIQRLANDKTITRGQITDALPGFLRKSTESLAEDEQPSADGDGTGGIKASETTIAPQAQSPQAETDIELSPEQESDRLRSLAHQRVLDAQLAVTKAKDNVSEAYRLVTIAEQRLDRALHVYSSKYPPMTVAANIKQHLARQQEILRERVTGEKLSELNPMDARMQDRKRDNGRKGNVPTPFLPRKAAVNY